MNETVTMTKVRPFWGRVLVVDSPVDEAETASGLIIPLKMDGSELSRAIVTHHDAHYAENPNSNGYPHPDLIPPGTVVFYRTSLGKRIGDVVIVDVDDIWAYEEG